MTGVLEIIGNGLLLTFGSYALAGLAGLALIIMLGILAGIPPLLVTLFLIPAVWGLTMFGGVLATWVQGLFILLMGLALFFIIAKLIEK